MAVSPMRFAILGNIYQTEKSAFIGNVLRCLSDLGAELIFEKEFYRHMVAPYGPRPEYTCFSDNAFSADFVVCMGGDGTFLKAAELVGNKNIPIIGINTGRLGFMAEVSPEEIEDAFQKIYHGQYTLEERSLIRVDNLTHPLTCYPYALNEVAIMKRDDSSMISIHTAVNGEFLATYQSDGLIISTPTGSTGYSLSVGGPILDPLSHNLILTAIAAHSLNVRPLVLPDDVRIDLSVESRNHQFLIAIDGRNENCSDNDRLTLRKSRHTIKFVRCEGKSFFHTLRTKLMWGADKRT